MSSSSVCQGLQSCLEPRLIEPRLLRLKLAPPGSNLSQPSEWPRCSSASLSDSNPYEKPLTNTTTLTQAITNDEHEHDMKRDQNSEAGDRGWSFLQSIYNISRCNKTEKPEAENVYVHPTVKCSSSSMLSAKNLEMCTESLGCETGSNASDSSDDMSLFSLESSSSFMRNTIEVNRNRVSKRLNPGSSFPPPLTSITDFGGVQVRPHREDGRLILEAVTSSSPQPYFHAERSNGRLRLRLFESVSSYCGDEIDDDEGEGETLNKEACGEEETGAEEECSSELEVYVGNGEDEMGMTKFARPRSCKESGNRDIFGDGYVELSSHYLCL